MLSLSWKKVLWFHRSACFISVSFWIFLCHQCSNLSLHTKITWSYYKQFYKDTWRENVHISKTWRLAAFYKVPPILILLKYSLQEIPNWKWAVLYLKRIFESTKRKLFVFYGADASVHCNLLLILSKMHCLHFFVTFAGLVRTKSALCIIQSFSKKVFFYILIVFLLVGYV